MNVCMNVDEKPCLCINCRLVLEGMKNNGRSDLITEFETLQKKVCNLDGYDEELRFDSIEIISSLMKQLGQTGRIERIVLKALDQEMNRCLSGQPDSLNLWREVKEKINRDMV